jgi:hypothetical protein
MRLRPSGRSLQWTMSGQKYSGTEWCSVATRQPGACDGVHWRFSDGQPGVTIPSWILLALIGEMGKSVAPRLGAAFAHELPAIHV